MNNKKIKEIIVTREPTLPGIIFKDRFIDELGLSISLAAKYLGVHRLTLSKFISGQSVCTPEMASRIAQATGTNSAFWVNLQAAHDTWKANQIENEVTTFPVCATA